MTKTYATIASQYYLLNSKNKKFATTAEAWDALKQYVTNIYTNEENETIIIDEEHKHIKIVTKNTKDLKLDRYVPIKDPVNINDFDANVI